ncbi:MAG: hypothetical protein Q9221_008372 [Calogaya cf. arnoldii]
MVATEPMKPAAFKHAVQYLPECVRSQVLLLEETQPPTDFKLELLEWLYKEVQLSANHTLIAQKVLEVRRHSSGRDKVQDAGVPARKPLLAGEIRETLELLDVLGTSLRGSKWGIKLAHLDARLGNVRSLVQDCDARVKHLEDFESMVTISRHALQGTAMAKDYAESSEKALSEIVRLRQTFEDILPKTRLLYQLSSAQSNGTLPVVTRDNHESLCHEILALVDHLSKYQAEICSRQETLQNTVIANGYTEVPKAMKDAFEKLLLKSLLLRITLLEILKEFQYLSGIWMVPSPRSTIASMEMLRQLQQLLEKLEDLGV